MNDLADVCLGVFLIALTLGFCAVFLCAVWAIVKEARDE